MSPLHAISHQHDDAAVEPSASAPVIRADRLTAGLADQVPRFADEAWPLAGLGSAPTRGAVTIHWEQWPALTGTFKQMAYVLINEPTPDALHTEAGSSTVEWPSPGTIRSIVGDWRHFAQWLSAAGFTALADITVEHLESYQTLVLSRDTANTQRRRLRAVSRLWAMSVNAAPANRLVAPPWESEDLTFEGASSENTTPVIHPDVMAPFLRWSLLLVQQAAPDILAMVERERSAAQRFAPSAGTRGGLAAARAILERYRAAGTALPALVSAGRVVVAGRYLATLHGGTHPNDIGAVLSRTETAPALAAPDAPLPYPVPVTGRIEGRPWIDALDYRQLRTYEYALTGACLVVIAYLTGMRPQEVMALRKGCVDSRQVDGRHQWVVSGRKFKRVVRDGRQDIDGEPRTWVTIRHVAEAVAVLEQLHPGPFLVPRPRDQARAMDPGTANERIAAAITLANQIVTDTGLPPAYRIPRDPSGPISLRRFRRTLAWHIRRLPGGNVALAVQYGHLSLKQGEGYAGTKTAGLNALIDHEDAAAVVDTLTDLADAVNNGEGISGPAVERARTASQKLARFKGAFLTDREVRVIKKDDELRVYDNPNTLVLCVYDPAKAQCGGGEVPNLNACKDGCGNQVWTDTQIERLTRRAAELRDEAANPLTPEPMALRLARIADSYDAVAQRHTSNRVVVGESS